MLVDFCTSLELPDPHLVLNDPTPFVPPINQWVAAQNAAELSRDDHVWLATRVGYLIGEYFVCRYSGCWFVDDNPDSSWFAHFVVGQFPRHGSARIAPMQMATELVESSGDLEAYLGDASAAIERQS
ncbi:hypothetical protein [Rhodopirellula halodulae]|uniref:hypothetical protein n=1 Tax=Rhodopirellula halodulae TaxID=2894198 RepID=UPI001E3737F1|nr:hypothetical protein [Rhodopirellula sp. JC737]MCC9657975.1 hypothetical protein [Rhodopirellula sp. JC737]